MQRFREMIVLILDATGDGEENTEADQTVDHHWSFDADTISGADEHANTTGHVNADAIDGEEDADGDGDAIWLMVICKCSWGEGAKKRVLECCSRVVVATFRLRFSNGHSGVSSIPENLSFYNPR